MNLSTTSFHRRLLARALALCLAGATPLLHADGDHDKARQALRQLFLAGQEIGACRSEHGIFFLCFAEDRQQICSDGLSACGAEHTARDHPQ